MARKTISTYMTDIQKPVLNAGDKILIYTRVSSKKQVVEGHGLEGQERACREFASNQDLKVVKVFSDGWISWKYSSRVWLDAMIMYLQKANKKYTQIPFVVIDDIDRIVRDVKWWIEIKAKIQNQWGAYIHSLKQNIDETPEWKMLQYITMSVKQYERENNARRTRDRQRARVMAGYRPFTCLNWYVFTKNPQGWRMLMLDAEKASIIKDSLEKCAKWLFLNQQQVADYMNEQGLKTKWWNKIEKNAIKRILDSDTLMFYAGIINYKARDVHNVKWAHPSIISKTTALKIMEHFKLKNFHKTYSNEMIAEKLPLRWSLLCECCWKVMTWAPSKNKIGKYYFYYTCRQKGCEMYGKSLNSKKVHEAFVEHLELMSVDSRSLDLLQDVIVEVYKEKDTIKKELNSSYYERVKEIDEQVEKIQGRLLSTNNDKLLELYENQVISLLEEKEWAEERLSVDDQTKNMNVEHLIDKARNVLEKPVSIWSEWDYNLRQLLIGVLFSKQIIFSKEKGIQTPCIPLIYADLLEFSSCLNMNSRRERIELPVTVPKTVVLPLHQRRKFALQTIKN